MSKTPEPVAEALASLNKPLRRLMLGGGLAYEERVKAFAGAEFQSVQEAIRMGWHTTAATEDQGAQLVVLCAALKAKLEEIP